MDLSQFNSTSFWLGVIGTLILSIIANIITPDRKSVVDSYKNWQAKRSRIRAQKRILELEKQMDIVKVNKDSKEAFQSFILQHSIDAAQELSFALIAILLVLLIQNFVFFLTIIIVVPAIVGCLNCATHLKNIRWMMKNINNFDGYLSYTQNEIESLRNIK